MEEKTVQSEAVKALYRQSALARKNGTADMTLEKINAEISAARADMDAKRKAGNILHYKGYSAQPVYSADDRIFYGRIIGIRDFVDFQSESADGLEDAFHTAVDDYLAFCAEIGKEPEEAQ